MSHLAKTLATLLAASLLAAVPASAAPEASAARKCSVRGMWRDLGASYVNRLETRRVTCADARSFSRLYHRCRRQNGGRDGRCPRVRRFRCSERRYNFARVGGRVISYDANVRCVRGSQVIRQTYTQLTR